ncbi:transposase [Bacillus toyonensis]|nr:transposase [Bacillus toyonensis]
MVEQDHRFIKKWVRLNAHQSFQTATKTLMDIETLHMIKKHRLSKGESLYKIRYK